MTSRERNLILLAFGAALIGATLWGALRLQTAQEAMTSAAHSLAECRRLAAKIEAARGPSRAKPAAREPQAEELIRRIESGAKAAAFPESSIDRIEPGTAQRIENSPYREKPTTVHLRGVNLQQIFTFLHSVTAGRSGLSLKDIRLSTPTPGEGGDRWSVEATLTSLVQDGSKDKE